MNPVLILSSAPDEKTAKVISKQLIEEKLAACVNIIPGVNSIFTWENSLRDEEEHLLIIKSIEKHESNIFNRIKSLHPYTTPELISIPIRNGENDYLNWISNLVE